MTRSFGLIGVPSSAGAKTAGIDKAPQALRAAGLVEALQQAGCSLVDHSDLPRVRHQPDPANPTAQNLQTVVEVASTLAQQVSDVLNAGEIPLILGGDCSITVGAVAGFIQHLPDLSLLYIDGGVDLEIPSTNSEGNLDSMGVTHMLGAPGTADSLSHIGSRFPLLTPQQIIYYGYEPMPPYDAEEQLLLKYGMAKHPASEVRGRAGEAARKALASLQSPFLIHFDVDVINFVDFPIADVPLINAGLTFAETMESLHVFAASPHFAGLVITEINPDHMEEDGSTARTFVERLAQTLAQQTNLSLYK